MIFFQITRCKLFTSAALLVLETVDVLVGVCMCFLDELYNNRRFMWNISFMAMLLGYNYIRIIICSIVRKA
jgi:hypothetical protein